MSSENKVNSSKEPFYFKSFDKIIGTAHNVSELASEFKRLLTSNEETLSYHLREGHITQWLRYIGEDELANKLHGVTDPHRALEIISNHISRVNLSEAKRTNSPQAKPHRKPSAGKRR